MLAFLSASLAKLLAVVMTTVSESSLGAGEKLGSQDIQTHQLMQATSRVDTNCWLTENLSQLNQLTEVR